MPLVGRTVYSLVLVTYCVPLRPRRVKRTFHHKTRIMKTILPIIGLLLQFAIALPGQIVQTETRNMSQGTQTAYVLDIELLDVDEVEDLWMDYQKDFKGRRNPKRNRRADEYFMDDAEISSLSANTIDVYSTLNGDKNRAELCVWFDLGGAYLNEKDHSEKMAALQDWMGEFARLTRVRKTELEVETEEDRLKELSKEFDRLEKEGKDLEQTIKDAEETIRKAREDLKANASAKASKRTEVDMQRQKLQQLKDKLKKID